MSGRSHRLTPAADADLQSILEDSGRRFGIAQLERYARLLQRSIDLVSEQPERPGSRARDDIEAGVRSYHVALAARRKGAASHVLYYLADDTGSGGDGVVILRILHDAMEPALHIAMEFDPPADA